MKLGTQQYVEKGHDGVSPTVELLSISTEENLIWDFSSWLLQRYPLSGIKIFMHPEHQVNISHRHFCPENDFLDFALARTRYFDFFSYIYMSQESGKAPLLPERVCTYLKKFAYSNSEVQHKLLVIVDQKLHELLIQKTCPFFVPVSSLSTVS
jgi:hypothetical protein